MTLPAFAVTALRRQRDWFQTQDRLLPAEAWQDGGYVFTTRIGTPMHSGDVTRALQRLLAAAELPRMRFHDLRHGAATLLLAQGVHPRVVMETLGHSTIAVTMNVYSHVVPALQRGPARRGARLGSGVEWTHHGRRGSGRTDAGASPVPRNRPELSTK